MNNHISFAKFVSYSILVFLFVFIFVPNVLTILTSISQNDPKGFIVVGNFSINGYKRLFDPLLVRVLWNSVYLAILTTLFCLLIGYAFAFAVIQLPKKYHSFILLLVILPFWTNSLIRIYGLKIFLGAKGIMNSILLGIGIIDKPIRLLNTEAAVIIGMVYLLLPFMILPIYTSLEKMDRNLLEAAKDLGASAIQRFLRIIIPLSLPGIVAGVVLVFIPSMGLFYVADVLGGTKILLIGNLIKTEFLITRNWPVGAAISIFLVILLLVFIYLHKIVDRLFGTVKGREDNVV